MSKLTDRLQRLRQLAIDAEQQYNTDHMGELAYPSWIGDVRAACRLMELADAWHNDPTQRNVAALSSFIKALHLPVPA